MSDAKRKIMQLVEEYAAASRQDEVAGMRDAPTVALKRHHANLTRIRADLGREVDALVATAGEHCPRCHEQIIENVCARPPRST